MLVLDRPELGAVATVRREASQVGLEVLERGGNAADSAVATAAALAVLDPSMTGLGGDAFAIVYWADANEVSALNASGRAPAGATIDRYHGVGCERVPIHGPLSVTVPGGVRGWHALHERYGSLPWAELLAPAVRFARDGCEVTGFLQVTTSLARKWLDERARSTYLDSEGAPLAMGARLVQPELADSLDELARLGSAALYRGDLGRRFCEGLEAAGGLIRPEDLAAHEIEWTKPLRTLYRGHEVLTTPPNSHGLTLLVMLNLLESPRFGSLGRESAARVHLQVEAKRLAFSLRERYVGEPDDLPVDPQALVSKTYAAELARWLDPVAVGKRSDLLPRPSRVALSDDDSDTTCFCVVDASGNAVSFINSLFDKYGSGIVAGDTGIVCQNRASSFSLDPDHVNALGAGRRPMHTLMPVLVLRDGRPRYTLGLIGGDQQPQGLLQVLQHLLDDGDSLDDAVRAPRMRSYEHGRLALEPGFDPLRADLASRGHELVPGDFFGGCQAIESGADGSLRAFSDPRTGGEPRGR